MMEGVIEVMDEFYSANLAQEVTRGMREATSRGFWVSSCTPYGYSRIQVQDGGKMRVKLEPDHNTTWVVQRMYQMALDGLGGTRNRQKSQYRGDSFRPKENTGDGDVFMPYSPMNCMLAPSYGVYMGSITEKQNWTRCG